MTKITQKALKATYTVRQWPADIVFLSGDAREVFDALGLTGAGKNQAKFLSLATSDTTTIFVNGVCLLVSNNPLRGVDYETT